MSPTLQRLTPSCIWLTGAEEARVGEGAARAAGEMAVWEAGLDCRQPGTRVT